MKKMMALLLILFSFGFIRKNSFTTLEKETIAIAPGLRMAKTEVTNESYRRFLNNLRTMDVQLFKNWYPDTAVWEKEFSNTMGDPMNQYYFAHPAFNNYPVVGVSYEGAMAYCKWATEEAAKNNIGQKKIVVTYRLPTKAEWEMAARLGNTDAVYAGGWTKAKGKTISKKEPNGYYFNHRIAEDNFAEDGYSYTGPVSNLNLTKEFRKSSKSVLKVDKNGFFHLAGNVAEMVAEKGVSLGGSFADYEDKARIGVTDTYKAPNVKTGFRYVVEIREGK